MYNHNTDSNNKNSVLIASTGGQDIKVLCQLSGNNTVIPYSIGKNNLRKLHQALIDNIIPWKMVASEPQLQKVTGLNDLSLVTKPGKQRFIDIEKDFKIEKLFRPVCNRNRAVIAKPLFSNKKLLLFPAKLYSVIESIDKNKIKAVALFYTDRTLASDKDKSNQRDYDGEPIATGKVLAQWLADKLNIPQDKIAKEEGSDYKNHSICHINMLNGLYIMEGNHLFEHGEFLNEDIPIASKTGQIIDSALHNMANHYPDCHAIVSHTGGFGDIKPVITASARLHFKGRIQEIHDNKYSNPARLEASKSADYHPIPQHEIMDAKHRATQRIWEGDFAGAWAVVSHIADNNPGADPAKNTWVETVRQAANFMEGWEQPDYTLMGFQPIPQVIGIDKAHQQLIWQSWQVEASLQFNMGKPLINHTLRHLVNLLESLLQHEVKNCHTKKPSAGLSLELKTNGEIKVLNGKSRTGRELYMECLQEYFYDFACVEPLSKFHTLLTQEFTKPQKSLISFRNDVAHRSLSCDHIAAIISYGEENKLWQTQLNNQQNDKLGTAFLSQQIIKPVFEAIMPKETAKLEIMYHDFVKEILKKIYSPG